MIFNSINYFLFLGITLIVFFTSPIKIRWYVLLLASLIFYASSSLFFLIVLGGIILLTYLGAKLIYKNNARNGRNILYIIIFLIVLLPLLFFKYSGFIVNNILIMSQHSSNCTTLNILNIIIPLGISYYTFQALSYIIDVRYGMVPEQNFWKFSLYMVFFPKLLMGPIERAPKLIPQFAASLIFSKNNLINGLKLILLGLFKKLVIADRIALYTSAIFPNYQHHNGITLLVASLMFTVQLYADFSGYTDIALGSARLFGIGITDNFNRPFFATSMTEFWRRWHITLTKWLNDYVFTPIALKWRYWGKWGLMLSAIITLLIIGIWHGSGWNFVAFGFFNGLALAFEIYTQSYRNKILSAFPKSIYNVLFTSLTFFYFSFTLIFFNVNTTSQALNITRKMFTFSGKLNVLKASTFFYSIFGCLILLLYEFLKEYYDLDIVFYHYKYRVIRYINYSLLIIMILLIGVFNGGQFIYFKF